MQARSSCSAGSPSGIPALVRRIAARGHEVASHGYAHRLVYDQTPAAFRDDVRRAKALLEDACGHAGAGYRAPSYSITPRSLWALDVLIEEGYRYDSSIFPIRHDRYGIPVSDRHPVSHRPPAGTPDRGAGIDDAARAAEPAGRGRRLLPHPALLVDALGHRPRQSHRRHVPPSSTCTRGRSIRISRGCTPAASDGSATTGTCRTPNRGCDDCSAISASPRWKSSWPPCA